MHQLMTNYEAIPYNTHKEKCAAIRLFKEEYENAWIEAKDGIVTCLYKKPIVDGSVMIM